MPTYGLRGATVYPYTNNNGTVTYGTGVGAGCAIQAQLELRFAEARLYACDNLAEYIREAIGGTITFGAKLFPQAAQVAMFGSKIKSRSISYTEPGSSTSTTQTVTSVVTGADDNPAYVGFAAYGPDQINGEKKWTAFFVRKVKFSAPSLTMQTKGETITFQTPQTTGEFLADDTTDRGLLEVATLDSEAAAQAWIAAIATAG